MAFSMKMSNESIQGKEAVPQGIYELRLVGFAPKLSKAKDAVNYNAKFEIVNHPEFAGREVYDSLSQKAAFRFTPFANALGMDLETDGTDSWLPGEFDGDKAKFVEADPTTWVYRGPLLNRICKAELTIKDYNGKSSNNLEKYFVQEGFVPRPM